MVDDGEVTSNKYNFYNSLVTNPSSTILNKRSFLMESKDIRSIFTEGRFQKSYYQLTSNNNIYSDFNMFNHAEDHIFLPFNFRLDQTLFEEFTKTQIGIKIFRNKYYSQAITIENQNKEIEKFIMTDIEFQDELISIK
jgi:hypothetical protein